MGGHSSPLLSKGVWGVGGGWGGGRVVTIVKKLFFSRFRYNATLKGS